MTTHGPRTLRFSDLEFKIQSGPYESRKRQGVYYATVAPYLRGHVVAEMMDEWVGPLGWKDHYEPVTLNGIDMMLCYLSVWDETTQSWIVKEDVGSFSADGYGDDGKANARKGGYSDALKRCASRKWGAGRKVYDLRAVKAPVDAWAKKGSDKLTGKITDETLEFVEGLYREEFPWLEGELHRDTPVDLNPEPTQPPPEDTHDTPDPEPETKTKGPVKSKAAQDAVPQEVLDLQKRMMELTGDKAKMAKDTLQAAGLWPIRDITTPDWARAGDILAAAESTDS